MAYKRSVIIQARAMRRSGFKILRYILGKVLRLWIKETIGSENIPSKGPAIFVSNHLSYFDFLLCAAVLSKNYIVFLAQRKIKHISVVRWFTKFDNVVYVDRNYPGYTFFKELMRHLDADRFLVIYPEGSRSRTGKMGMPKLGFVKLAMKANVPIIPVAMNGTFEILPPSSRIPRLKRCKVFIGKRMYISPDNPEFHDIFFRHGVNKKLGNLTDEELQKIAVHIMDKIRILAEEEWDNNAAAKIRKII